MGRYLLTLALFFVLGCIPGVLAAQSPPPAYEGYADLPGVRIWYTDTGGSGVPVIFLHSGTGITESWGRQIADFSAAGYRCISYDRRDWGRSVRQPSGPQPGTAADDLLALLDHLRIDRAHLVGSAAGGLVVLDFVLSYPDRLRSAVVSNNGGTSVQETEFQEMSKRLLLEGFSSMPPEFRELSPAYRAANPEGMRRWVEIEHNSRQDPSLERQPVRHPLTTARLGTIKTPMLVMTGAADLHAPAPMMRMYAEAIKTSESLVIPEAGHSAFWEQPELFNRAVLQFIGKH